MSRGKGGALSAEESAIWRDVESERLRMDSVTAELARMAQDAREKKARGATRLARLACSAERLSDRLHALAEYLRGLEP